MQGVEFGLQPAAAAAVRIAGQQQYGLALVGTDIRLIDAGIRHDKSEAMRNDEHAFARTDNLRAFGKNGFDMPGVFPHNRRKPIGLR